MYSKTHVVCGMPQWVVMLVTLILYANYFLKSKAAASAKKEQAS